MHPIWFSINYPSCAFYVLRNPDQLFGIKPFLIFFQTWYLWFLCNHTWQRISGFACRFCVILLTSKPTQNVRALNFLCKMLVSYHYKLSFEDWNFPPFAPFNKDEKWFFFYLKAILKHNFAISEVRYWKDSCYELFTPFVSQNEVT